ncbi:MAG: glycosyltransferase, partial [Bacteroidota bacterium]
MRRVLILSYYFPPSGGPGVQRVLKFTRYLPETGWMPTVVTVDPKFAAYPNLDPDLEKEVPEEVLVHRTRSWDPYALYARVQGKRKEETVGVGFLGEDVRNPAQRFGRWLRANVFLPDARVGWMPFCVREAVRLTGSQPFDAIISSGPPHSVHLSGLLVQRWTGLPWLADFRDPWTEIDFYQDLPMTAAARAVDRAFERLVLGRANGVSVVGPAIERMYREKSDGAVRTIFNGYDEQDF